MRDGRVRASEIDAARDAEVIPLRPRAAPSDPPRGSGGHGDLTDATLVAHAIDGAQWAKETLYRRHATVVRGLAYRMSPRDADDLSQDAFLIAFRSLPRLESPQAFASFVCSIVVRTARKRLARERWLERFGLARAQPIDPDTIVSADAPPDVAHELRTMYAILGELPADARIALVLRRVEGMTLPEIATAMGVSLATAKRRLSAGEVLLGARLSRDGVS